MLQLTCLIFLFALASLVPTFAQDVQNANHIFNAIHSSMRQWGSSLHHNGMSFFVANIPAGTQLYHGRSDYESVKGMEWVAFEPEHAAFFARPRGCGDGPGGRPSGPPGGGPPPGLGGMHPPEKSRKPQRPPPGGKQSPLSVRHGRHSSDVDHLKDASECYGWLHTLKTKRDLQFLYVDGLSAGKSNKGTMDAEDYVLLNRTDYRDGFWEHERAQKLCKKLQDEWGAKLAGIIRMEAGFEIIMCSFEDSLDEVYRTKSFGGQQMPNVGEHFAFMKAISSRYQGIGGNRVTLDYDRMATAYKHIDVPTANEEHRLVNVSDHILAKIRRDVYESVFDESPHRFNGINWQIVTDMLVARWSDFLLLMTDSRIISTQKAFDAQLFLMLKPFINGTDRNATEEALRCSRQFLSSVVPHNSAVDNNAPSLTQQAVNAVSLKICKTVVEAHLDRESSLTHRVGAIRELVEYLQWTSFKDCRGCAINEVCMTAIWPFGTEKDHYNPSCQNLTDGPNRDHSYWRTPGQGPGGPGGPGRIEEAWAEQAEEL